MALEAVASFLACPHCEGALAVGGRTMACASGHVYDVARQGYVSLLTGRRSAHVGDSSAMVAARWEFLAAGHFDPLATAVADVLGWHDGCVLDLGAGTGQLLATVLRAMPTAVGIALDASTYAARRAARVHPRIGAVVADVWGRLPIRTASQHAVCTVFAPRHPEETARVLGPGGSYVVVTPTGGHLREVREQVGLLDIPADKLTDLDARLRPDFQLVERRRCDFRLHLDGPDLARLVAMGPTSRHLAIGGIQTLRERTGKSDIVASVDISRYRRLAESQGAR